LVIDGNSNESRITILASKRNPVAQIVLGNNYDFTIDTTPLASTSASPIGFPVFALDTSIQPQPKIETQQKMKRLLIRNRYYEARQYQMQKYK